MDIYFTVLNLYYLILLENLATGKYIPGVIIFVFFPKGNPWYVFCDYMPKISNQNQHLQSWILRLNKCMKVFYTIVGEILFIWISIFLQNPQKISSAIFLIPCEQIAYTVLLTFGLTLACMCWMYALSYGRKIISLCMYDICTWCLARFGTTYSI